MEKLSEENGELEVRNLGTRNDQSLEKPTSPDDPTPKIPIPKLLVPEIGGPAGPEPTRYGDWEVGGRCSDF